MSNPNKQQVQDLQANTKSACVPPRTSNQGNQVTQNALPQPKSAWTVYNKVLTASTQTSTYSQRVKQILSDSQDILIGAGRRTRVFIKVIMASL